jgi:hypothetical protein
MVNLLAQQQQQQQDSTTTGTVSLFSETPHRPGYKPTGGRLPLETADYWMDEKMWRYVENGTCVTTTTTLTISEVTGNVVPNKYNQPTLPITKAMQDDSEFVFYSWQKRAPYAILLGAMKCGTHAVTASLWEHPLLARLGHWELHFFNSDLAIRSERGIDRLRTLYNYAKAFETALRRGEEYDDDHNNDNNNNTNSTHNSTTPANVTSHFVKEDIDWKTIPMSDSTFNNSLTHPMNYFAIESCPEYLLSSDRIPDVLLCTAPWVKLLAVLRDPIRRVESQYKYLDETRKKLERPMVDWDVWIQDDLRLLNAAGVLTATTPQEEVLAWKTYQRRPNSNMIVGRGLYVIQLEQWYAAMDKVGKSRRDLLVLQSEAFRSHRQEEYNRILEFLHLPHHRLRNTTDEHVTTTHEQSIQMPHRIRELLHELYEPYNQRLYKLLGWDVTSVNATTTASAARWMAADRSTSSA